MVGPVLQVAVQVLVQVLVLVLVGVTALGRVLLALSGWNCARYKRRSFILQTSKSASSGDGGGSDSGDALEGTPLGGHGCRCTLYSYVPSCIAIWCVCARARARVWVSVRLPACWTDDVCMRGVRVLLQ